MLVIEYLEQNKKVNMFKNKKLIIFDMDGTLIDSVGIWNEVEATIALIIFLLPRIAAMAGFSPFSR